MLVERFRTVAREHNRVLSALEQETRAGVCRVCEHFALQEEMPTCARCTSCSSKVIRIALARWRCPLGRWPEDQEAAPSRPTPDAAAFTGRIGVVIPVRNEGVEIIRTVRSFRAAAGRGTELRFFVVDDGSVPHRRDCEPLRRAKDIRVLTNREPRGEGVSRNAGAYAAIDWGADGIVWTDAHMRMETPQSRGFEALILAAMETQGVICATCLSMDATSRFVGNGASFVWREEHETRADGRKEPPGLRLTWAYSRKELLEPVQAIYGACYAMTVKTFETLGGWMDTAGLYGYGEQALSIRAWFQGIGRFCHTGVRVRHLFRGPRPYPMSGFGYWQNYVLCNRVLFGERTFEDVFLPLAKRYCDDASILFLAKSEAPAQSARAFAGKKVRTDREFLSFAGMESVIR